MQHSLASGDWAYDWLWGVVLIVATAMLHTGCLAMIAVGMQRAFEVAERSRSRHPLGWFFAAVAAASLSLVILHGLEASLWAAVLVFLGASPTFGNAIYFSLQMATTIGSDFVQLANSWRLMGPLEGISGMLMFGLSTAFLFAVIQRAWPFSIARAS